MEAWLTFIVPVYNLERYAIPCLESIAAQTDKVFQAIVVNDGSTDGSLPLLRRFCESDRRFLLIDQPNGGVSAARNIGLERCRTPWVWFVDGDDLIAPNALELLGQCLEPADDIVGFDRVMGSAPKPASQPVSSRLLDPLELRALRLQSLYAAPWEGKSGMSAASSSFSIYRRAFLGDLRYLAGQRKGQDALFNAAALARCQRYRRMNAALYFYRRHEGSVSIRCGTDTDRVVSALLKAFETFCRQAYPGDAEIMDRLRCRRLLMMRSCLFLQFCNAGNPLPYQRRREAFQRLLKTQKVDFPPLRDMQAGFWSCCLYFAIRQGWFFPLNLLYRSYTRLALKRRRFR